jgi:hypothetical protein
MFGEGVISSSESPAPSALGVPEPDGSETVPGIPKTVPGVPQPFRTLRIGERSSPRCWTGSWRPELGVAHGSQLEAALEGGWRIGLAIWQSAREVGGVEWRASFSYWGRRPVSGSGLETGLGPESENDLKSVGPGIGLVRIWQTPCSSSSPLQSGFRMGPFRDWLVGCRPPAD